MELAVFAGRACPALAAAVATSLGRGLGRAKVERFPDGEIHVEIAESVRGQDVYLIQSTSAPVHEHLVELLLLADACRRAGAARLTAVMPYFAYARQDRRAGGREAVGARLVADLLAAAGVQRVVAVDLHSPALEGFFGIPLEHLSAVPILADAVRPTLRGEAVVVAPDLGAVKLAERYARRLQLPVAIVHKTRLSGEEVRAGAVIGEVRGRMPLIIDDMISTGGTIEAAARAVIAAGAVAEITVVASHALLVGAAAERLRALPLQCCIATDSVATAAATPWLQNVSLGPLLAEAIERLHTSRSLDDLIAHA